MSMLDAMRELRKLRDAVWCGGQGHWVKVDGYEQYQLCVYCGGGRGTDAPEWEAGEHSIGCVFLVEDVRRGCREADDRRTER